MTFGGKDIEQLIMRRRKKISIKITESSLLTLHWYLLYPRRIKHSAFLSQIVPSGQADPSGLQPID